MRNCEITIFQSADGVRTDELWAKRREGHRRLCGHAHQPDIVDIKYAYSKFTLLSILWVILGNKA